MDVSALFDQVSASMVLGGTCVATIMRAGWADAGVTLRQVCVLARPAFSADGQRTELASYVQRMQRDGVPPSFDEMKDALDLRSKSGIHRLITALEERGFIRRLAHRARAIEIVKLPEAMEAPGFQPKVISGDKVDPPREAMPVQSIDALELPVMGRIAAGTPIEAISEVSQGS